MSGLIVDNFAGGGGASIGIEAALGRAVDIAINHDEEAIRMHEANHPDTVHIRNNIWQIDPREVTAGKPVDLAWFSPDCKHFSKAKGGKPRDKSIRDLAWVVVLWAQRVKPALILLENVEEFRTWGPLCEEGKPIKERKGETFEKWCRQLRKAGYKLQFRELRACDYGAPTIRKRFFMVARCDGQPIVWPKPTHGAPDSDDVKAGKLKPWRTAAEIIDWSVPCPSIFERKKPLAEKTLRRIAHGIVKFVINNPSPFIVPLTHHGSPGRSYPLSDPLPTVTGANRGEMAVVSPHVTKFRNGAIGHDMGEPLATVTANSFVKRPGGSAPLGVVAAHLVQTGYGERKGQAPRAIDAEKPLGTVVAGGGKHALAVAHMMQANGGPRNETLPGRAADAPMSTVATTGSQQQLVTSNLVKLRGTCAHGQSVEDPLHTVSAGGTHMAEVRAFLIKYYGNESHGHTIDGPLGTVTVNDRFGLVTVTIAGEEYVIVDIGLRMLTPRELFAAQGFPPDYIIEHDAEGRKLTKTAQVAKCGNSVCPPLAEVLVRANAAAKVEEERVAA
jgi:DNA (cytosine-5)-methyltransferase 1